MERPGRQRLRVFNGGFIAQARLRRILHLAGYDLRLGRPRAGDAVAVWGDAGTAHRGRAVAARTGAPLVTVEDAFLRSLHPGGREAPLGLLIDRTGLHFDPSTPSELETLLATHPLDDTALLDRARGAVAAIARAHLTKYAAVDADLEPPPPGYVLVIDQTRGDASVRASGAGLDTFREMLVAARLDHPDAQIVVKTHPETAQGRRPGHYGADEIGPRVMLEDRPISPWLLFEGARAVYTVSSGLGFEAIFAGHRPRVFGQPFYSGWSLTEDMAPVPRRTRSLTRAQLFAAAMILYPTWYDPHRDRLCEIEEVIGALGARARAWREDRNGWEATGMRLWKRRHVARFFGSVRPVRFVTPDAPARGRRMAWGTGEGDVHVEDGFLRSRGLGAALVPPLSLVADDLGLYYDPTRESRLERHVAAATSLDTAALLRAERLAARIVREGVSKYNLGGAAALPPRDDRPRILVPGQVEDDASIRLGADRVADNAALLAAARAAHPEAMLIYKPHPDVEAGLRPGAIAAEAADLVVRDGDPAALLAEVDGVWTMTSLLGFEALLRGVQVTCLGTPFYAGWGLTTDLGAVPARRRARPSLAAFVHAVLIDYPRYLDPVTGTPCTPEVILDRLAHGPLPRPGPLLRATSKLQGLLASRAHLWR
ncbi:MAG: capsular polysaccharide biosynthesis protein [Shimia sp.]